MNDEVDFPEDMLLAAISIVIKLLMKEPAQRLGSDSNPSLKGLIGRPYKRNG
jgi:hypothetical protein